jgi:uncharacterized protein YwgA
MQQHISRRNLLLLLVGLDSDPAGLGGITRLQKLLFLLEEEEGLKPTEGGYEFEAYKAGPYSPELYDDLEFLENLGLLKGEVTSEASEPEAEEVDLSFDHLMGQESEKSAEGADVDGPASADSYEERRFRLTDDGRKRIEQLLLSGDVAPVANKIRRIKSKYGKYSLNDLLYHVYTKYPEMTTESEIRDKVLRRGSRR